MTGPKVFNLDDEIGQKPQKEFNLDDVLGEPKEGFEKIGATVKGGFKSFLENTYLGINALTDMSITGGARAEIANRITNSAKRLYESAPILGNDLLGFFDAFSKKQVEKIIEDAGLGYDPLADPLSAEEILKPAKVVVQGAGKIVKPFFKLSTYPALAAGVVDMFTRPAEILIGEDFSQDRKPLTPEETAERSKHLLGDAIMILATHNVAGLAERSMAGEAVSVARKAIEKGTAEELSTKALLDAAKGPKTGAIARKVLSNTAGGAVGGFVGGLVQNSGEDDALEAALINAVMGVPLGFAQEYATGLVQKLRGKTLTSSDEVAEIARSIAFERQLKLYADDSYESALAKLEALKNADNLQEAADGLPKQEVPVLSNLDDLYDDFSVSAYQTSKILDAEPVNNFNFDRHLADFLRERGLGAEYVPGIRDNFIKRLRQEVYNDLEPDEKYALNRLTSDLEVANEKLYEDYVTEGARVQRKAAELGMYVDKDDAGVMILRDIETGNKILEADSDALLNDFAKEAGRAKGINNLAHDIGVPSEAIPGPPIPPPPTKLSDNIHAPFSPRINWSEKAMDIVNTSQSGSLFTSVKDVLSSLDNINKTSIVAKIWDTTQPAYRRTVARLLPYQQELNAMIKGNSNLSREQWKQIQEYREARTAKELVDRFTKTRGVSELEQAQGKWFADNDIDIDRVFKFRRLVKNLEENGFEGLNLENARKELEVQLGMDSKHLDAYTRMLTILEGNRNTSDLGAVIAYARALKSGISKADYATKNKMTAQQLKIAKQLDNFYDKLADDFGIEDGRRLQDYMNHYRRYKDFPKFSKLMDRTEEFISNMARTGEITEYETHPIIAAMRYATAGIKVKEFYPTWNRAKLELKGELTKILDPVKQKQAKALAEDYLEGIIGNRQYVTEATVAHITSALKSRGMQIDDEMVKAAVRRWQSNYFAFTEASAQGLRPSQGIRDFYGTVNNHYIRFGAKRSTRALTLFNKMTPEQLKELEMTGEIGTLQAYQAIIPGDATPELTGRLSRGFESFLKFSFESSLQKTAYRNGHAMVYNETLINTLENLGKLVEGKLTKEQAYKNMSLHTYDPQLQVEFDKMVSQIGNGSSVKDASQFLARLTAAENVFLYGAANQPRLMTTLPGAMLGQFGVWSMWESRFVTRMMTRGTIRDRLKAGMRYTASQASLRAADGLTGFNLSTWFLTPSALAARLGPAGQAAQSTADLTNPNQRVASLAKNQVEAFGKLLVPAYQSIFNENGSFRGAYDLWSRGFDPVSVAGKAAGFGVDEVNKNWWDLVLRSGGEASIDNIPFVDPIKVTVPGVHILNEGKETGISQLFGNQTQKKVVPRNRQ